MGQTWLAELEIQAVEALGGRRQFPLIFPAPSSLSSEEIQEAAESVGRLSPEIGTVEYRGGAGDTVELVVRRASTDPCPPPGLEAWPREL